ncbi:MULTISPECIES: PHP domain-containing protein [unclassified Erwinia]|jgi:putative hydrolase|uniref:PHP domain-containing protein n=1 Tax=unclassified Erwinia TaxID=2622719 RepID=UPI00263ACFBA|nr:PHP domain-containing protein [Erwinia sp. PsM31]MDN4626083.1 PHP domain-containing protein [Erwinia sp. PsM31]
MNLLIDLHIHTHASAHAYSSVYEHIVEAKRKNMLALGITDHGPALDDSPHRWHFLNMNAIPKQIDGMRILKGIEANIFEDGKIDCDAIMADKLDYVMAGFHSPVYPPCNDIVKNTDCLMKVINHPSIKIIVHPGNPHFPLDYREIAIEAARNNVALEVNSGSAVARKGSLPNCRKIIAEVMNAGGYISVGSDSHFCTRTGNLDHAVTLLEEQQVPSEIIINSSLTLMLTFLNITG